MLSFESQKVFFENKEKDQMGNLLKDYYSTSANVRNKAYFKVAFLTSFSEENVQLTKEELHTKLAVSYRKHQKHFGEDSEDEQPKKERENLEEIAKEMFADGYLEQVRQKDVNGKEFVYCKVSNAFKILVSELKRLVKVNEIVFDPSEKTSIERTIKIMVDRALENPKDVKDKIKKDLREKEKEVKELKRMLESGKFEVASLTEDEVLNFVEKLEEDLELLRRASSFIIKGLASGTVVFIRKIADPNNSVGREIYDHYENRKGILSKTQNQELQKIEELFKSENGGEKIKDLIEELKRFYQHPLVQQMVEVGKIKTFKYFEKELDNLNHSLLSPVREQLHKAQSKVNAAIKETAGRGKSQLIKRTIFSLGKREEELNCPALELKFKSFREAELTFEKREPPKSVRDWMETPISTISAKELTQDQTKLIKEKIKPFFKNIKEITLSEFITLFAPETEDELVGVWQIMSGESDFLKEINMRKTDLNMIGKLAWSGHFYSITEYRYEAVC